MDQMWCDDAITRAKQHHTKQNENLFLFLQHGLNVVLLCTYYSLTYPVNKNNSYFAKQIIRHLKPSIYLKAAIFVFVHSGQMIRVHRYIYIR